MKTVASIFNKKPRIRPANLGKVDWVLPSQLVGIEIEAESIPGTKHPEFFHPYWASHSDGSLLSGKEWVLTVPLAGDALSYAINTFFCGKTKLERSTTGSTHIHLDMTEEDTPYSVVQILVLMLYSMESVLFAVGDPGREWCNFANKLSTAPEVLLASVLNCTKGDYRSILSLLTDRSENFSRYYGTNLKALYKYGSIEFRYFPTASSAEELVSWIQLLQSFKKAAKELGSVKNLVAILADDSKYESFVAANFKPWYKLFMEEVPRERAFRDLQKAMAIASSSVVSPSILAEESTEAIITDNPLLSKFCKNGTNITPLKFVYVSSQQRFPEGDFAPAGTPIFHGGTFFIMTSAGAIEAIIDSSELMSVKEFNKAIAAAAEFDLNAACTALNRGPGNEATITQRYLTFVSRLKSYAAIAISRVSASVQSFVEPTGGTYSHVDDEGPELPDTEPDDIDGDYFEENAEEYNDEEDEP